MNAYAYYVQVFIRCQHPGCTAMVDLLLPLGEAVYKRSLEIPPGWSHRRYTGQDGEPTCYSATALCPAHGDPCIHTLEQQTARKGEHA